MAFTTHDMFNVNVLACVLHKDEVKEGVTHGIRLGYADEDGERIEIFSNGYVLTLKSGEKVSQMYLAELMQCWLEGLDGKLLALSKLVPHK